jgi:hypothetical protein
VLGHFPYNPCLAHTFLVSLFMPEIINNLVWYSEAEYDFGVSKVWDIIDSIHDDTLKEHLQWRFEEATFCYLRLHFGIPKFVLDTRGLLPPSSNFRGSRDAFEDATLARL